MENNAIINRIDESILAFVDQITEPYKNDHDMKMFYDILTENRFQDGKVSFKLRIGSARRLQMTYDNKLESDKLERLGSLPYNEFKIQIRLTSKVFHLMVTLFHNEQNKTEGFSYHVDDSTDSDVAEETWVLPEGNDGRRPELLFNEVCTLHKLNREMRIISELEPTQEVYEINRRFDKLMESSSEEQINWALSNELETDEKIRVLKNLGVDRKSQIIENLTGETGKKLFVSRKEQILEAVIGQVELDKYKKLGIKKFAKYDLSDVEILTYVTEKVQQEAVEKPYTKVYIIDDVFFTAHAAPGGFNYGIGVDPDKNTDFKPYEE